MSHREAVVGVDSTMRDGLFHCDRPDQARSARLPTVPALTRTLDNFEERSSLGFMKNHLRSTQDCHLRRPTVSTHAMDFVKRSLIGAKVSKPNHTCATPCSLIVANIQELLL